MIVAFLLKAIYYSVKVCTLLCNSVEVVGLRRHQTDVPSLRLTFKGTNKFRFDDQMLLLFAQDCFSGLGNDYLSFHWRHLLGCATTIKTRGFRGRGHETFRRGNGIVGPDLYTGKTPRKV
jgi:hypothetical protein